jgi:putative membrane protein
MLDDAFTMIDYDAREWRSHLFDVNSVRAIAARVLLFALWATVVTAFDRYVHHVRVSDRAHSLIGVALGLLLVFRTNASYDRFWEARKLWGAIVNESRNIARAVGVYMRSEPELAVRILRWAIVFPWSTMNALRNTKDLGPSLRELPEDEVRDILASNHIPLAVSMRMSTGLAEARRRGLLSDYVQMKLDQNVQLLIDYMGGCERIRKTPLPFRYVVHLRRALLLYCLTLPFALLDTFGWATIAVVFFISYILVGIEEIGVEIEDPFGFDDDDLPLEKICTTIEQNIRGVMLDLSPPAGGGIDETKVSPARR